MFVLVIGGGGTGSSLAQRLLEAGHTVRLIEWRVETCALLRDALPASALVPGDGTDPHTLHEAGIHEARAVVVVTGSDEANLVVCTLARFEFAVPLVISRVNEPRNAWLFTPDNGVDLAINQPELIATLLETHLSLDGLVTLLQLRRDEISVLERHVQPLAAAVGRTVRDLGIPSGCALVAIRRAGRLIAASGDLVLSEGDQVLALGTGAGLATVGQLLG